MSYDLGIWYCESASWYAVGFSDDFGNLVIVRSGRLF